MKIAYYPETDSGIKLTGKSTGKSSYASEFYKNKAEVKTRSAK
jgi:hypothetical protein